MIARRVERPEHDVQTQGSLLQQIKFARFWLPVAIVGVVLGYQLFVVPQGGERWQFWSEILFYSIVGPLATYLTLNWIVSEVKERERAQNEQTRLYHELQRSHRLLSTIQRVTERFASATDLDAVLSAASEGIAEVTNAEATAILIASGNLGVTRGYELSSTLAKNAAARNRSSRRGEALAERFEDGEQTYWVLSAPLVWGGKFGGSVHAYYRTSPSPEQRESFSILSSEFSAATEATRSRTKDLLTLVEVDRSIRAEGNLERLLETLLTQMMTRADAQMGGVYLFDDLADSRADAEGTEGGLLQLRAWHGLAGGVTPSSLRLGEGFIGQAAAEAEPRVAGCLEEVQTDPVLARAGSAISLPLRTEEELLGSVVLAHTRPNHFNEANLPFLNLLAGQVSLAVRNARAYLQSEELAIAEERARIAREIHDGVAQSLAFSALKLDLVSRLITQEESDTNKALDELTGAKKTIRETIKEVRRSIFALRPIDLERHGFVETIRRYCLDYHQQNDVHVTLQVESTPRLTLKSEAVLFRIFQESLNNVAKHAGARHMWVTLGKTCDSCGFIEIRDDGRGFDLEHVSDRVTSAGGLGLRQMRERILARGGRFEVVSKPSQGTRIYASLPE